MPNDLEQAGYSFSALPEYEKKLLVALATFLGRSTTSQSTACLAMYLRQSADRILNQCRYYAHCWGMNNEWEVLDYIFQHPERARELIECAGTVHSADEADVFAEKGEE